MNHVRRDACLLVVFCLIAATNGVPASAADGIHVAQEPTGKAVQVAIDACASQGGGVAYLPPGRYVSGPLWLKDNVELRLEAGAVVVLSHDKKDWPTGDPALVNAKGAKHIAIAGRGTFDGAAQWEYRPVFREDPEIKWEQENAQRAGVEMKRYYRTGDVQKRLFLLRDCEDVRLEGVTILNAPLWNVHLQDCNRVWIHGIYLYSDLERGVNSDGIDIVSSANVAISDSTICTADDAICLKTSAWDRDKPEPEWGSALVLRDVSDLTLQDFQGQAAAPDAPAVLRDNVTERAQP